MSSPNEPYPGAWDLTKVAVVAILVFVAGPVFAYVVLISGVDWLGWRDAGWVFPVGVSAAILLLFAYQLFGRGRAWKLLKDEAFFVFWRGRYAWGAGCLLALLVVAAYLNLPQPPTTDAAKIERIASSIGLYIGVVGIILGIHTLYLKTAPITSVNVLLEHLRDDLIRYGKAGNQLLICYPALNIGYYRALDVHRARTGDDGIHEDAIPEGSDYKKYRKALRDAASALGNAAEFVTYESRAYKDLFTAYAEHKESPVDGVVDLCDLEASRLVENCLANSPQPQHTGVPSSRQFPPQAIVIGPVCYLISSYGMPRWNGQKFVLKDKRLAELLVYRREDPALAALILKETKEEIGNSNNNGREPSSTRDVDPPGGKQ